MCPEPPTKAHLTRCDMYYKCSVMKSDNIVWLAENCPNGLVYDSNYGNCVVPGECKQSDVANVHFGKFRSIVNLLRFQAFDLRNTDG